MASTGLLNLPAELQVLIFSFLPTYPSVVRFAHTHPNLRSILKFHHNYILPKPFLSSPTYEIEDIIQWQPKNIPRNWTVSLLINGTWSLLSTSKGRLMQTLARPSPRHNAWQNEEYYAYFPGQAPPLESEESFQVRVEEDRAERHAILVHGLDVIAVYPPGEAENQRLRYTREVELGLVRFIQTSSMERRGEIDPMEALEIYRSFGRVLLDRNRFDDGLERRFLQVIYYTHVLLVRDPWKDFEVVDAYVREVMLSRGEIDLYVGMQRVREELLDVQLAEAFKEFLDWLGRRISCSDMYLEFCEAGADWEWESNGADRDGGSWLKVRLMLWRAAVKLVEEDLAKERDGEKGTVSA